MTDRDRRVYRVGNILVRVTSSNRRSVMTRKFAALAGELSLDDLRRLLVVKERLTELETRRGELETELAAVRTAIADLVKGGPAAAPAKATKKTVKKAAKKTLKKTVKKTAKKTAKKTGKKAGKRRVVAKKPAAAKKAAVTKKAPRAKAAAKKAAKKPAPGARKAGKATLESVVARLIKANGGTMTVQEILGAIAKGKLVKSKSSNFANVLRRTLSTSTILVSAGRGSYKVK
ncbi:MAG: hypothetical protein IPM94_04645 [bacterium]|nr:hypothetical protein [bacterium]